MNVNEIRQSPVPLTILKQTQKRTTGTSFDRQLQNTSTTDVKSNEVATPQQAKEHPAMLTNSEKEYFEQLFPNAAEEVRTYNPYRRDGATIAVKVGTHIDRKG